MMESRAFTILNLSDEILLHIVSYIQIGDIINLSETCSRLDRLVQDRSLCRNVAIPWNADVPRKSLVRFLLQPDRSSIITQLTLHDAYWIPSGVIKEVVLRLKSLQGLFAAGTSLSYTHLLQILGSPSTNLSALSWTWDKELESLLRPRFRLPIGIRQMPFDDVWSELLAVRQKLELLSYLLIHIPDTSNYTAQSNQSHISLGFLISLCTNLEQLWILSWPKTSQEIRYLVDVRGREQFHPDMKFPRLHTLVMAVQAPSKIHAWTLTKRLLASFETKSTVTESTAENIKTDSTTTGSMAATAKNLWVDHPWLDADLKYIPIGAMFPDYPTWPMLNLKSMERFCLPLSEEVLKNLDAADLGECKHLSVTHGCSQIISLNGLLKKAVDLESFHSKALNGKIEWQQFIQSHPKLRAINVSEEVPIPENPPCYPDACVAMAKLNNLQKISLPVYCLFEIRFREVVADYYQKFSIDLEGQGADESQTTGTTGPERVSDLFSKGRRVGRGGGDLAKNQNSISGLDLLTLFCPDVDEVEIGFTKRELPGKLVIGSLANISRWTHLKKLTLDSLPITDGQFLIDIAKGASHLESLRLRDLGPSAKCVYMKSLCSALKLWSNLRDFRLEQRYIGSTKPLCQALESCPKLERLFLHASPNDFPLEPTGFLSLMDHSSRLRVLYLTLGSANKSSCAALRKELEFLYKRSRPGLSISIQARMDDDVVRFHSVHYRDMVVFTPRVCAITSFSMQ